jgi:glycosyltransferase involved in cell wall biosynthesis
MRVLVAHNLYRSATPSGENDLVRAEIELLSEGGVEVASLLTDSDDIPAGVRGVLTAAPGPVYAPAGVRRFKSLVKAFRPDVIHVHNVFPLISPWIVRVATVAGLPVVQTVHNYRHGCINGLHLRDGRACTDCLGTRLGLPGLRHGCYRDSRVQSVPMTIGRVAHRGTWAHGVDRFLVLTPFMRAKLVEAGIPADRISVRPTWVRDPGSAGDPGRDVLFVGRLDTPKGVDRLLDAWAGRPHDGRRLVVAGDGPLRDLVASAAASDPSVVARGLLTRDEVMTAMGEAAVVVVPSRVFEGYPLVVAQAFARGRAVVTVSGGSVGTIVDDEVGWVVAPTSSALGEQLTELTDEETLRRGRGARQRYEAQSSPGEGLASLLDVYESVLTQRERAL